VSSGGAFAPIRRCETGLRLQWAAAVSGARDQPQQMILLSAWEKLGRVPPCEDAAAGLRHSRRPLLKKIF